ncbi:MAG: RNA-binding protein [Methylococcaceae bacterium]|nr:RNA-binding protein [Methylococcaceae bacterium]
MTVPEAQRLDKWLWAARFFKTRQLATEAVAGGKVHLNGQRAKPGKELKVGATLVIGKDQLQWEVCVVSLNNQRRPASEACLMYTETPESVTKRQQAMALQREENAVMDHSIRARKPNKKDRRLIHQFKQN